MNIYDKVRLLFRREKKPYLQLKAILGFYPRNIRLYQLALKHKSVAHFEREDMKAKGTYRPVIERANGFSLNNERLEYLGDAILGAVVADILYRHYGNKQEGFLTNLRSKIVCRKSLNQLAVKIGLDKLVQHTGAVTTGHNSFMNGNAFEAFFGAIYLDRGYAYCYRFMEQQVFRRYINVDNLSRQEENFKSSLIEWCQKYQYDFAFTQKEVREGNAPKFHSSLSVEGLSVGKGEGYSKKESDQAAARNALRRIRADKALVSSIKEAKHTRLHPDKPEEPEVTTDDAAPAEMAAEQSVPESSVISADFATQSGSPKEVFSSNWD